jgi:hypothetical protein
MHTQQLKGLHPQFQDAAYQSGGNTAAVLVL